MQDYFVSMYQVLKAIENSSYSNSFNYDETLNLEKLKLTEEELMIIINNIIDDELVKGMIVIPGTTGFKAINPRLTTAGYLYLKDNSEMQRAYKFLKEIKGWIPGLG
nr:MAG TPA: YjcQ protein [Caudoviricetes sp.]